jgi:hypothetical protein
MTDTDAGGLSVSTVTVYVTVLSAWQVVEMPRLQLAISSLLFPYYRFLVYNGDDTKKWTRGSLAMQAAAAISLSSLSKQVLLPHLMVAGILCAALP